ncbi:Tkl protein kinase, partial [Globisporangium splendens]
MDLPASFLAAIKNGCADDVLAIVARGASINYDSYDNTPLLHAIANGKLEIVRLLIQLGAAVDDNACLKCSIERGYGEIAQALLQNGASIDEEDDDG